MFWKVAIIVFLGVCNLALFGRMVWSPTGLVEYRELKRQHNELKQKIADLDAENGNISREILLLQTDAHYVEKMVRQKLHYMRDNEIVYLFTEPVANGNGESGNEGKN